MITHAFWQASSMSSDGALTVRAHGALKLAVMPAMEIADLVPRDRGT
jgi:hypothetical protein